MDDVHITNFPIIGIGASAGGLEALEKLVANIPKDSGYAYVIVQHLSPDYKSLMVELLSKHTTLKIERVTDAMQVFPNTIYLIPPKKTMRIFHGKLYLSEQEYSHGLNLPIDIFFRSLAEDQGDLAVGVILSGTGSDGTLGIRAIKGAGGMVIVQDPNSAKFDGMPRSAIATNLTDFILNPEDIPQKIIDYFEHLHLEEFDSSNLTTISNEDNLSKILSIVREQTGVDFTYYKPNTIIRRLERRISINQIGSLDEYLKLLNTSKNELKNLYKDLLINVTKFFRDSEAFEALQQKVITDIVKSKTDSSQIRVWCVGCSTGEEAYSIAILFKEVLDNLNKKIDVKVFATDIDKEAIEIASSGVYPESIVADVQPERLKNFFIRKNDGFQISDSIRRMVIFATHNIIKDPPFSKIDLISCRNMLIYFKPVMQEKIINLFHFALNKHGYIFLGTSETIGDSNNLFSIVDSKWKLYRYKESYLPMPVNSFILPAITKDGDNIKNKNIYVNKLTTNDELLISIYEVLITEYLPPSVVIDENFNIIHIFKDVNKYVKIPSGKISLNIQKMLIPEIATVVGVALHKVFKNKKEIIYKDFQINFENNIELVTIRLKPITDKENKRIFVVIMFEVGDSIEKQNVQIENYNGDTFQSQRIKDLEQELIYTKENLQAAIEELETSNEELQSTNEELVSSNEELQSTNEELQSVNEELYTVNSEYQNKIEELTRVNNDINNLLRNTNIGVLFLDRYLKIRKFTPSIAKITNIIDTDTGRPFTHISHNLKYNNFIQDIENVLNDLKVREQEIQDNYDNWYIVKILPYRTLENAIDGVVITFTDITERKKFEQKLENEKQLLKNILDNNPIGNIIIENDFSITYANNSAMEILGLDEKLLASKIHFSYDTFEMVDENGNQITNKTYPLNSIFEKKDKILNFVMSIKNIKTDDRIKISLSSSPVIDGNDKIVGVVLTILKV